MNPLRTLIPRARRAGLSLALAALAGGAHAQLTFITPADNLAEKIEQAAAGSTLVLQSNAVYTLNRTVAISPGLNDNITIRGTGGATDRPDKLIINLSGTANIELLDGATLNLEYVTLQGGSPYSLLIPTNATVNASQCLFTLGAPAGIRMAGSPTTGGKLRAVSCVFANSSVGVVQQGGEAIFFQCTFTGTTPGVRATNGRTYFVACLFEASADAPDTTAAASGASWLGSLIGNSNAAPAGIGGSVVNAPTPGTITFDASATGWPGKLDTSATPLLSGLSFSSPELAPIVGPIAVLNRREDFEGDLRATALQVGADELAAAQLAGWISATITPTPNSRTSDQLAVAGAAKEVRIDVEVRGINLNDAELLIVPELGTESVEGSYTAVRIIRLSDTYGYAMYTTPATACTNGQIWDGLAEVMLREAGTTIIKGSDTNLPDEEYTFIIDTTAPLLGELDSRPIEEQRLDQVLISNDPTGLASVLGATAFNAVDEWEAALVDGYNPSNLHTLGVADASPLAFFNFDPLLAGNSFTLPMQFIDFAPPLPEPGSPCAGANTNGIRVSGFNVTPASVSVIDDAFKTQAELDDVNDEKGRPYLAGEPPQALRTSTFTQTAAASPATTLEASWNFSDLVYSSGWNPSLVPAATDLAGNKYVHPNPLRFAWLLETDLVRDNGVKLKFSGNLADPSFSWSITRPPVFSVKETYPAFPVVSYRLWRADDPARTGEGYEAISDWSPYTAAQSIDRNSVFIDGAQVAPLGQILADTDNVDQAMLLTVMVGDEAGNLQENNMVAPFSAAALTGNRINSLEGLADEGVVPYEVWKNEADLGGTVDTRLRAKLFWNRVYPDLSSSNIGDIRKAEPAIPGERDFGSSTRVPLPPEDNCDLGVFTRLEAQFYLTAASSTKECPTRQIQWQLTEDGRIVSGGVLIVSEAGNYSGVVQIPQDLVQNGVDPTEAELLYGYPFEVGIAAPLQPEPLQGSKCPVVVIKDRMGDDGDPAQEKRRRAVKYVFRAATLAEGDCSPGSFGPEESTPVTFQWVVTPSDEFGDKGDDQPTKTFSPL